MNVIKFSRKILSSCLAAVMVMGMPFVVSAAEQLPAPTNPHWDGETGVGVWDNVENSGGNESYPYSYRWKLYRVDAPVATPTDLQGAIAGSTISTNNESSTFKYNFSSRFGDSGYYYFAVAAMGDGLNYTQSPFVFSDAFHYTRPNKSLPVPENLEWKLHDGIYHATWSNLDDYIDTDSFRADCYNADGVHLGSNTWTKAYMIEKGAPGIQLSQKFTAADDTYYFTLRAESSRPNEYSSSATSAPSPMLTVNSGIVDDPVEDVDDPTFNDSTMEEDAAVNNSSSNSTNGNGTNDNDDDDDDDSSSGSSGSPSTTTRPSTSDTSVRDAEDIKELVDTSSQDGKVKSRGTGEVTVTEEAWKELSGNTFRHDTIADGAVQVRVTISNPEAMTQDVKVSAYTTGKDVEKAKATFDQFFENSTQVVHFDQKGTWGQEVRIAAKLNPDIDTDNLRFYSYDSNTNKYRILQNPQYSIDANGYVHFSTEYANSIVISDGPLKLK